MNTVTGNHPTNIGILEPTSPANNFLFIPCSGKVPAISDWPNRGTNDPTQLAAWKAQGYNLGVLTGTPSAILVIDVDGKAGEESIRHLREQGYEFPPTYSVKSGRTHNPATGEAESGWHAYYRLPVGVVHSMDRLARNLGDLRKIVEGLTQRGVKVQFLKEGLDFTSEDNAMSNLLLNVMGAFAEFERSLIKERQREGIALAKRAGVYKGRKPALTAEKVTLLRQRIAGGVKKATLARELGISRQTLDSHLKAK